MATPPQLDIAIDAVNPAEMERVMEWSKVLEVPAGKKRFQAIRALLKDHLQVTARAPSTAKSFLSEKLLMEVGPTGSASKLPRELRRMLGTTADDFAREVQTGYYFLTGKAPGGATNAAFKNMLSAMREAGMPAEHISVLRKIGPEKLVRMGGPGRAVAALAEAQKDPGILRLIKWAGQKMGKGTATPPTPIPLPIAQAAAKFKPTAATYAGLGEAGVKGMGKVSRVARGALKGMGVLPTVALGLTAYSAASTVRGVQAERERASQMATTGVIPSELGGEAIVGQTAKGEPITAGQFLRMLEERENQLKLARFHAATKEQDLTRDVMSYLSGGEEQEQKMVQRVRLGSARPPASAAQPPPDAVMKQFNALLRQATAGQPQADFGVGE